jgi:hypothetical protein
MASYKDYKSISAAQKAGSLYFTGKDGKKKLAVTKEQLDKWKKKNKGKFKGSALTAWANAKGKDIKGSDMKSSPRPKARPGSKTASQPKIRTSMLDSPKTFAPSRSPTDQLVKDTKKALTKDRDQQMRDSADKPGNKAAKKALDKFGSLTGKAAIARKKAQEKVKKTGLPRRGSR